MNEILPCPFCGHSDLKIGEPEPNRLAVDCPECECIGPFAVSVTDAITAWNRAPRHTAKVVEWPAVANKER